jgi:DNA-binding XRE family transcriptional regulator
MVLLAFSFCAIIETDDHVERMWIFLAVQLKQLRALRERAALSQEQLAERSGVSRYTISRLETLERSARPTTTQKLAKALGVVPAELMEDA